jgi:hypothetical protein
MIEIIEAQAYNFSWPGYGRKQPHIPELER